MFRKEVSAVSIKLGEGEITCMSRFVMSTTTRELIFGSLNSGFSSFPRIAPSGSATCSCFPKLELGQGADGNGSSTTATSTLDILDLSVLTQPHDQRRGPKTHSWPVEFRMIKSHEFGRHEALNSRRSSACGFRECRTVEASEQRRQCPGVLPTRVRRGRGCL